MRGEKNMRMSAIAKHRNFIPKENSKTQIKKQEEAKKNYRPKLCCEKCKSSNATLYNIKNKYYCVNCKNKI